MNAKELGAMPANPVSAQDERDTHNEGWGSLGLTIRQRFAMAAMQGLLAYYGPNWDDRAIRDALRASEQMLAELAKDQP